MEEPLVPGLTTDEQRLKQLLEDCMDISSQSIRDQLSQKFATSAGLSDLITAVETIHSHSKKLIPLVNKITNVKRVINNVNDCILMLDQSADFDTMQVKVDTLQAILYTTLINVKTSKIDVFVLNRSIFKF